MLRHEPESMPRCENSSLDMTFRAAIQFRSVLILMLGLSFQPIAAEDAPRGICEDQIAADLKTRFGQSITKIDWSFESSLDGLSGLKSQALVYTDGCPGYHVYDVYATDHDCLERVHYGQIPNYVRYRTSEAGC